MGSDGTAFPSAPRIAGRTRLAERTVRDVIRAGIASGWLIADGLPGFVRVLRIAWDRLAEPAKRTSGKRRNPGKGRTPAPAAPLRPVQDPPAPAAGVPLRPAPETPAPAAYEADQEADQLKRTSKQTSAPGGDGPPLPGGGAHLPDLWAALVAWTPKPGAWKLTPGRRKHLAARTAEHGPDAVIAVASWVRESRHERAAFLRQRGDPDTLLRPEKFATYLGMSAQPATASTPAAVAPTGKIARGNAQLVSLVDWANDPGERQERRIINPTDGA